MIHHGSMKTYAKPIIHATSPFGIERNDTALIDAEAEEGEGEGGD